MNFRQHVVVAIFGCALLPTAQAQVVQDRAVFGNGGGNSSSASYQLVDTLGENGVGESASADYGLRLGFAATLNLPPVPQQDQLVSTVQGGKLRVESLLDNDGDPDGEPLTLKAVAPSGASGGTVTVADGWLLYQPASSAISSELLTYTVADTDGNESVGTVLVRRPDMVDDIPRTIISLTVLPAGTRSIVFAGIAARSYSIQTKDDLSEPTWTERKVVVAGANGQFGFDDPQLPAPAQRYYRAIAQ